MKTFTKIVLWKTVNFKICTGRSELKKWLCIFSSQLTRFHQRYRRWNQEVEKRNRLFKSWCWSFLFVLFFCIGFCYSLPFYVSLLLREGRRENSKTWLDPMDLESLVSTTCTRMFPYQKMYEISGRAGIWSKEKGGGDIILGKNN